MKPIKDYTGKAIKVGDLAVYPVRRRSGMVLKSSRISHIKAFHVPGAQVPQYEIEAITDTGRKVILRHPGRLVIVEG